MAKIALLIGVSNYEEPGLNSLPTAARDVQALREVLQHPDMGGFAEPNVEQLINPDTQTMRQAIELIFSRCRKEDLVLFYFSGHGIKDENGKLYLTASNTRKREEGSLIKSTAVEASFIQARMEDSYAKQQVLILDCCFSGAFPEGMKAKDDGTVEIKRKDNILLETKNTIIEGRAILTSSTSTQYSFEQQNSDLSTYTKYLVQGIKEGAADENRDSNISVEDLHAYVKQKVREETPAMRPELYAIKEGYKIIIAKAHINDPKLNYRWEVECAAKVSQGKISDVDRSILDVLQDELGLTSQEAASIEREVLEPYIVYTGKLERYKQELKKVKQLQIPLGEDTRRGLKHLKSILGIRIEDAEQLEKEVLGQTVNPQGDKNSLHDVIYRLLQVIRPPIVRTGYHRVLIGIGITAVLVLGGFLGYSIMSRPKAEDLYNQAMAKTNREDYRGAIDSFNEAIRLKRNDAKTYLGRGISKLYLRDADGALEDINKAISLKPDYADAYYKRGVVYQQLKNDSEKAIEDFNKTISLDNRYAAAYINRGNIYSSQKKYNAAFQDFEQVIQINADTYSVAGAYFNRGLSYAELGNLPAAIDNYTQAIQVNPNLTSAYLKRCQANSTMGNLQEVIEDCSQAIQRNPQLTEAYFTRGLAYRDKGNKKEAIQDYTKVIQLAPDYTGAYNNRGNILSDLGDYSGAIKDYSKVIEMQPNNAIAYNNRGYALFQSQDYNAALNDYQNAIEIDPKFARSYENIGNLYLSDSQNRFIKDAIANYQKAKDLYLAKNQTDDYQRMVEKIQRISQ